MTIYARNECAGCGKEFQSGEFVYVRTDGIAMVDEHVTLTTSDGRTIPGKPISIDVNPYAVLCQRCQHREVVV